MAEFKATVAQATAISSRDSAILVSAGAGSGKTRVLTERLMSYICAEDGVDIDSFLIITFTRAAAAELRGRIMDELASRLASDPTNRRLRRQSALCRRAQIGTIHSFCSNVLRENCHAAGLSPDFKIVDEERAAQMRSEALERVLERRYEQADERPGFKLLVDSVGAGRDDARLYELAMELHSKMQCHARPELWARTQVEMLKAETDDLLETPWGKELMEEIKSTVSYWAGEFDRLMQLMATNIRVRDAYMESFSATADALRELLRCLNISWDRARKLLPIEFPRLGSLIRPVGEEAVLAELLKSRRKKCADSMKKLADILYSDSATLLHELRLTAPAMEELLSLTLDFDRQYSKDKQSKALVDYADLEHLTARLLTDESGNPSELARKLSIRYTEIMVDEYQDVSRVQDAIFAAISKQGRNLFLVGDVKQSIYRFRLADPNIFTEKYLSYSDPDTAKEHEPRRILLRENFRSRREVIDAANSVFSLCMSSRLGDMEYDDNAALICGASYESTVSKPELCLLALPSKSGDSTPDKTRLEAELVARRIQQLIASGETVSTSFGQRPIQYGDIAILLRSANNVGPIYRRVLSEWGIPVSSAQGGDYFESLEVSTVLSMLSVLDNPHKDIPLIAVLRSPSLDFSPDELSEIRACDRHCDLYSALCIAAVKNEKCQSFLTMLHSLRTSVADMSATEITWRVIEELDMLALCTAMNDGGQRRDSLMALLRLAESFEATGYRGLHRYNLWLKRISSKGKPPATGGSFSSAVSIMSIHKSKGLEFPVVFVCDLNRKFNKSDGQDTVLVHPVLGLGPKLTDLERRVEYPTFARYAIKLRLERETLSEEMRLLYVALTRAKERLIMTAAMTDPDRIIKNARQNTSKPMAPEILSQAMSPAYWLIYSALSDNDHMSMSVCQFDDPLEQEHISIEYAEPLRREESFAELERRLSYVYPHQSSVELPSKLTATELKGRMEADDDAASLAKKVQPIFRMPELTKTEKKLTATQRGIATHLVLQYMDLEKGTSRAGISSEIKRLEEQSFISASEAEAVNVSAIERLFSSELGKRMLSSSSMLREFKFSILVDASRLYSDADSEQLLLQGVVDCCIEEDSELVIIDYKTDYVKTQEDISKKTELYRPQLEAYAEAMSRICKKRVKECVIFFLHTGNSITLIPE